MHHRRGTGRGLRGMTTPRIPVSALSKRHPALPLCAALALISLSGCVSATDPTLMAGNQAYAPSETMSLAPVDGAQGSAPGSEDNGAFSIAETGEGSAAPADPSTMTAMAADPSASAGFDARNRSIMQNGQAVAVSNLYSTTQNSMGQNTTGQSAAVVPTGEAAPGAPVPSPSPERQLGAAAPVEVAALASPAAESPAAQALDQATASVPATGDTQIQAAPAQTQPARPVALAEPPQKKSFFGRLFGSEPTPPKPVQAKASRPSAPAPAPQSSQTGETEVVSLRNDIVVARASAGDDTGGLPGVRMSSLFEIQAGNDEDGEDAQGVEVASAAGLARLAPNGLHVQTETVDIACLKPQLVKTLKTIERHYGRPVVVTSGFRSPKHNRKIGGARNSRHTSCEAADIQVAGVSKWDLAAYVRAMPGRGGVGTYCHTRSVHVDIGTKRDWNWRCRRRK